MLNGTRAIVGPLKLFLSLAQYLRMGKAPDDFSMKGHVHNKEEKEKEMVTLPWYFFFFLAQWQFAGLARAQRWSYFLEGPLSSRIDGNWYADQGAM